MNTCPYCHRSDHQIKSGINPSGSQRWKCQHCQRRYTPKPTEHGYPDRLRQQAVQLYVDGWGYRRIARHLKMDHKTVIHWVKVHTDALAVAPVPSDVNNGP